MIHSVLFHWITDVNGLVRLEPGYEYVVSLKSGYRLTLQNVGALSLTKTCITRYEIFMLKDKPNIRWYSSNAQSFDNEAKMRYSMWYQIIQNENNVGLPAYLLKTVSIPPKYRMLQYTIPVRKNTPNSTNNLHQKLRKMFVELRHWWFHWRICGFWYTVLLSFWDTAVLVFLDITLLRFLPRYLPVISSLSFLDNRYCVIISTT